MTDFQFGRSVEQGGPKPDVPYTGNPNDTDQPVDGPGDTGQEEQPKLKVSVAETLEDQSDRLERIEVLLKEQGDLLRTLTPDTLGD